MSKYILFYLFLLIANTVLLGQPQDVIFFWPLENLDNQEPDVDRINSNLGDYRSLTRFHLGIDIQETPNADIYPITNCRVYIVWTPNEVWNNVTYTTRNYILELGEVDENNAFTPFSPPIYAVYLHLLENEIDDNDKYTAGQILDVTTRLSPAGVLFKNHLHFNLVTDLNNTNDVNDDRAINPLAIENWEINDDYIRPRDESFPHSPYLRHLYVHLSNTNIAFEVLNYPDDYDGLVTRNNPQGSYHQIEYHGNNLDDENYDKPKILINMIGQNSAEMSLILHATNRWNDTGMAPYIIQVYIDENSLNANNFNTRYYNLELTEVQAGQPRTEIVYKTDSPLRTLSSDYTEQYYRLYRHSTNMDLLPNQIINAPINLNSGDYSEEGMHRIEITLKGDPYYENEYATEFSYDEKNGILYYYLLKNPGGYMDLAQSGTQ